MSTSQTEGAGTPEPIVAATNEAQHSPRPGVLDAISAHLPPERILLDPALVASLSHDDAEWAPIGTALAVVRPETSSEVQAVVRACYEHRVPVVARGAGTGLSGAANAVDGCIVIALDAMNRILEINQIERLAVVQPGVINDDLRAAAAQHGLWYPPDPASSATATIGGNVATNAGGVCCVKYGVTRDYVLGLEMVTGTGELVRLGRRTAKGVAGYDLVGLVVGSEGTLGVVTEVTVRLRPLPPPAITVVGYFASIGAAGTAIHGAAEANLIPAALELVDRHCLRAVDAWKNLGISADADVVLLAQFDEPEAVAGAAADRMLAVFQQCGATHAARSSDAAESARLFSARRLAYPAVQRLGPVLTEDVCVPIARVAEMLERIEEIAQRNQITIANIAHAGDGNLHPLLITDAGDEPARVRAQTAYHEILSHALEVGGTVTGEHGIGLLRREGFKAEVTPEVMAMHRAVRLALDPAQILNPGKVC